MEKIVQFFLVSLSQSISENLKSYQFKIVKTISKEIPFFIILESRDIREDSNKQFTGYLSVSVQCSVILTLVHFKSPAEFLFFVLSCDEIVGHDELFEIQITITISVECPEPGYNCQSLFYRAKCLIISL